MKPLVRYELLCVQMSCREQGITPRRFRRKARGLAILFLPAYELLPVSRPLAKLLAVIAAVQLLGGHWLALQSVAWMGMVISFAKEESLVGALEKTFSGENPCQLCHVVKEGQSEEKKQEITKILVKVDAILAGSIQLPLPMESERRFERFAGTASERSLAPPTPPPLV